MALFPGARLGRLVLVLVVGMALLGTSITGVGAHFDANDCGSLDGYMDQLHTLALEIGGPNWAPAATPVASPTPTIDPVTISSKTLIAKSAKFHQYAEGLKEIDAPPIAEAWQQSRIPLMETFASYYQAIGQRGAYAAAIWTTTLDKDLQQATADTFDLMLKCRSFRDQLEANDYFGAFVTSDEPSILASPASEYP
jgi:hypothetical protein